MKFGIPNQRKKRVEKYPENAILTLAVDGGKGTSRAMFINTKGETLLGLSDTSNVAFSFAEDTNDVYILNAKQPGVPEEFGIRVTKALPRKVSDKRTYEYISKILELDNTIENHFELVPHIGEDGDPVSYHLVPFIETQVVDEKQENASFGEPAVINDSVSPEVSNVTTV